MDGVRNSFSQFKKDVKNRLRRKKYAPDGAGDNAIGERIDSSGSLLRPDSHATASGHDGGGSGASTDIRNPHSRDRSPQLVTMRVGESRDDPPKKDADVGKKEVGREYSHAQLDTGVAGECEPGREIERAHPSPSVPSIQREGEPNGAQTLSPLPLPQGLIIPPGNADAPAIPDHVSQDPRSNEKTKPSVTPNEKKSNWKSTAYATAKLLLCGVRDSADAFGPLKSVAGGLCFILDNCEVGSSFVCTITTLIGI